MRIHGSSDYTPKAELKDGKAADRAASSVNKASQARPVDEVTTSPRGAEKTASPDKASGDAVVLSATASRFVEVSTETSPDVQARLAEVKKLLDEGTYEVDFDRLADRLLGEEIERKT